MKPQVLRKGNKAASRERWANRVLQDFGRTLLLVVDHGSLQAGIAARLTELFGCERVVFFHIEPGRAFFTPHFGSGVAVSELTGFPLRKRGPLAKWLQVNEMCLVISGAPGVYEYLDELERGMLARFGIQMCVPLISFNRFSGIIMLGSGNPDWRIAEDKTDLLESLAAQAALALENALLYQQQRERLRRIRRAESLAAAGQLAAGVAHEIRNPLTSIRSTIQYILQDYSESNPKTVLLRELLSEADRIDRTVDGLLSLTRTCEFQPEPVDIREALEHSLVLIRPQAERKGATIELNSSGPRLLVMGVADELKQVFLNILLNALHAVSKDGVIRCHCEEWTQDFPSSSCRWAQVTIRDSGTGIAPQHLDKIFDPFFTTKREGTGLGLSVCHNIIQRHEGEIDLQSVVGKGTVVYIRLPIA